MDVVVYPGGPLYWLAIILLGAPVITVLIALLTVISSITK